MSDILLVNFEIVILYLLLVNFEIVIFVTLLSATFGSFLSLSSIERQEVVLITVCYFSLTFLLALKANCL